MSRLTPRAPSPPGSNRRRRSATNAAASPSNAGRERDEPRQVVLAHELSLAELVGRLRQPAGLERGARAPPRPRLRSTVRAGGSAAAPRRARAATSPGTGCRRRAAAPRSRSAARSCAPRIATSSSAQSSERIRSTIAAPSASGEANGRTTGSGPSGRTGAQHLLGAAELRHEPVREREHLRRRAVVLLEPHDGRVREARRDRRAGARVRRR